ncbi:transcription-repair coupling factor [Paraprevotella xylaniphila YIT 11841]|jgi:transcription-repair coupling factor (superfamily II helicase)|uniref:Transcription-repair-coupling factor n=1 Tax=Paraprevotella xylaniphila YIT 11841 TaxID=762982 RepID=F3QSI1_9BACT|nr:transcription-repair coupling factor [Paraprevotella xylaniphila]EGG55268.1 transcription-repair coupling factor [Paraprevotella xylaniphila YIT 11841]
MEIQGLQALYAGHKSVKALAKALQDGSVRTIFAEGLCASAAPLLFSSLAATCPQVMACPYVFVLDDAEEAGYFYHDLTQILGEQEVFYFPSSFRRAVKFGQRDAANEILRTEVISRLSAGHCPLFVVTYPEAVMEKVVSRQKLDEQTLRLHASERVDITFVEETLRAFGFRRVDYVYEPGQFAVRGSILDVFSFSSEWPYRVDFFGDEVDSIRTFEVQTQLSRDKQEEIVIVPELAGYTQGKVPFTDFLPPETVLVMKDLFFLRDVADRVYADGFSTQALMDEQARTEMEEAEQHEKLRADLMLIDGSALMKGMLDFRRVEIGNKPSATPQATVRFHLTAQPIFHKNFELVNRTFHEYLGNGYTLYILADSAKQTDRLASIFTEQASGIDFTPVNRTLHAGFADDDLKTCFFTDHQIFDRFHKYNLRSDKARSGKVALSLKELQEFNIGDYVVHVDHGVGKFGGLVRIPNGGTMQEVIKIIYQNDDVVFVSIHSLHKVSKYRGKEGEPPRLNKLGTGAWERLKERTKTKIKDIARDLIKLYSLRRQEKGFAFSPDSFMQHELEASFLYEDTPDQLKATQAVKADMERDRPMDRLVCGDVGFGKTEVAIRAAFKACADNKQVAVLVPTTVLAYQHFQTFSSRLKGMPVRVDYLSRARSAAKTKDILKDLADGKINIIVGTHKLIGKSVKFKDLGLLIIDEEQKFGVATKEKLRQMKVNVDTLTLTATPIPRTLQFSLMGARDLSVIQTPPPNRYPVQTEVHTFSAELIAEAVNFEMSRNGQVFIVNNRISSLYDLEALLHKHVPDARVCVGHGQMPPEELEKIILGFVNYDYDVLVSTTIIESGIDIPNANTIIINGAQNFGLSDLHQMRGRVGRSNKKAFCYLLAPPLAALTPEARRRLQAIENFSDLGSGIHIAMQDLDIRGAGNLLGAEQSGFIADLGYETYQKILSEAVKELKNDEFGDLYAEEIRKGNDLGGENFVDECALESDLQMSFPDDYVPSSSERMLLYRELDGLERDEDVEAFRLRMKDRFGEIPEEGEELIRVVALRRLGKCLGAEKIFLKAGRMVLYFVQNEKSAYFESKAFGQCIAYAAMNAHRSNLREANGRRSMVIQEVRSVKEAVQILRQISELQAV